MMYPQRASDAAHRLTGVLGILNQSTTMADALPELQRHRLAHSEDAVRMVLRRAGLGKVSDHLGTALTANRDFVDRVADVAAENDDGPPTLQGGFEAANDERPVRDFIDLEREPENDEAPTIVGVLSFIPDIHAGAHDEQALSCAIEVTNVAFADFPVEQRHLVQLGDLLDNDSLSHHPRRNMAKLTFSQEVAEGRRILQRLRYEIHAAKYSISLGNHDDWIQRYKISKCKEFADLIHVHKLLELEENGWEWVPYRRHFTVGRTHISHEFGKSGANAATSGLNSAVGKVFGHCHRLSVNYAGLSDEFFRVSATLGWLGSYEHADYGTDTQFVEQWCQGMGIGYLDSRGFLWLQPVPILNGSAIFNGRVIQA